MIEIMNAPKPDIKSKIWSYLLVKLIQKHGGLTGTQLHKMVKRNKSTVYTSLNNYVETGMCERQGSPIKYRLTSDGKKYAKKIGFSKV